MQKIVASFSFPEGALQNETVLNDSYAHCLLSVSAFAGNIPTVGDAPPAPGNIPTVGMAATIVLTIVGLLR